MTTKKKKGRRSAPSLRVEITHENWDTAVRSASGGCLVADAIKRQHPHLTGVTVDMATVRATDRAKGERYTWLSTPVAQHLLLSYDQGWPKPSDDTAIVVDLQRPVKVTSVVRSQKEAQQRGARLAELEDREVAGETLTRWDRAALTRLRRSGVEAVRDSTYGPVEVSVVRNRVVVHGGHPLVQGPSHPNLLRGRNRHFGAKLADPGVAFQEAVDAAVAERMASESQIVEGKGGL